MTSLEQCILRTVAYFDLFHYPLTPWEIWKWLPETDGTVAYANVVDALRTSSTLRTALGTGSGFVYLAGQEGNILLRQERYRLALLKFKRAQRFTQTLVRIPFVRAVFACNSLGLANARAESDIDFFIIVERKHVWAARLLAAGWARLRKLRPLPSNRQDTICLSFFIADSALDLHSLRLPDDPYLTYWLATLVPLYDPANLRAALWEENMWVRHALPNTQPRELSAMRPVPARPLTWLRPFVGSRWFERFAERVQQRVLAPSLRRLANQDSRVVLNDRMLKFHDNDRRLAYSTALRTKLTALGITV